MAFSGRGTGLAPAGTLAVVGGLPPHVAARRPDPASRPCQWLHATFLGLPA